MPKEINFREIQRLLSGATLDGVIPDADSDGKAEGENFSGLEDVSKKRTETLRKSKENFEVDDYLARETSQKTKRRVLYWLQYFLLAGALLISSIAVLSLLVVLITGVKVGWVVLWHSPADLVEHLKQLPPSLLVFGGIAAPFSAVLVALMAWLFKPPPAK